MKTIKKVLFLSVILFSISTYSQGSPDYNGGLKVSLNEDGSKYFRLILWSQFWVQHNEDVPEDASETNLSIRRARALTYAQITPNFLILSHFGLNNLNADNISPDGKNDSSELFLHGAWGQWSITKNHAIGGGLHYWNGISRLNNQSTLNLLTLDNNRQSWATLGLSDQFARHIGVYVKGNFNKLQYRVSINEAAKNTLDANTELSRTAATYNGRSLLGGAEAGKTFAGYFDYNFLDQESNFLPYKTGSYLGTKKIFNVGAGFFHHPNGSVILDELDNIQGENVTILSIDAFYDAPLGDNGSAITAYVSFQENNYGTNFNNNVYATGNMFYGHVGYVIPNDNKKIKVQPYVSYNNRLIDAINDRASRLGIGANLFLNGHNSKISLEYANSTLGNNDSQNLVTLQAMVFL